MDDKLKKVVIALLCKAEAAQHAPDSINFSQSACNAANALRVLADIEFREKNNLPAAP